MDRFAKRLKPNPGSERPFDYVVRLVSVCAHRPDSLVDYLQRPVLNRLNNVALIMIVAAMAAQSVLHDYAHGATLIWERSEKDHVITVKETWSLPGSSRIVVSTYSDSGGLASRMIATTRGKTTKRVEATIDTRGATLVSGDRMTLIAAAKKLGTVDPSVLWFVRNKPAEGTTTTFTSFDPEFRYWEEVTVTFVGQTAEGNVVTRRGARGTTRIIFDDKGAPVAWQEGRLSLKPKSAPLARSLRRY